MNKEVSNAINELSKRFNSLNIRYSNIPYTNDKTIYWPGKDNEDICLCVFKGKELNEVLHKQDFFFFNYAYKNSYEALSSMYNNSITIAENDLYISQPNCSYAIKGNKKEEVIIIGVLIKKEVFFRDYLYSFSNNNTLFNFFLNVHAHNYNEEFIKLSFKDNLEIKTILELMVVEYLNNYNDSQDILKTMLLYLIKLIIREYNKLDIKSTSSLISNIISYITNNQKNVTLDNLSKEFGYHPNYISSLIHKETGLTFKGIVLKSRMERAVSLLKSTTLSIEEISEFIGYNDTSNFYKAFKDYYGKTPREYIDNLRI